MRGARRTDLDGLDEALRLTPTLTRTLFREVMQNAGERFLSLHQSGKVPQIDRLIESHAWTDAAFALIGFAIPKWSIRRIIPGGRRMVLLAFAAAEFTDRAG
jgi:hypothetical protein